MGLSGGNGGIELTPRATINKAFIISNLKLYTHVCSNENGTYLDK